MNRFKERIRELRDDKGLKQLQVATALRISPATYANWEQGRREPSIDNLVLLCNFFNVTAGQLIGMEEL